MKSLIEILSFNGIVFESSMEFFISCRYCCEYLFDEMITAAAENFWVIKKDITSILQFQGMFSISFSNKKQKSFCRKYFKIEGTLSHKSDDI